MAKRTLKNGLTAEILIGIYEDVTKKFLQYVSVEITNSSFCFVYFDDSMQSYEDSQNSADSSARRRVS